jgi:hypothetical protein
LGAGPGDLIKALGSAYPDTKMLGIDLSPTFVDNFNSGNFSTQATMDVGLIDRPLQVIFDGNRAGVISVLTLDRLTNPGGLLQNMVRCTKGRLLATLLPVNAADDNPSRQDEDTKIVYTRPENLIVPGKDADEDREILMALLRKTWKQQVNFAECDYAVDSSGDTQKYLLNVFYTS